MWECIAEEMVQASLRPGCRACMRACLRVWAHVWRLRGSPKRTLQCNYNHNVCLTGEMPGSCKVEWQLREAYGQTCGMHVKTTDLGRHQRMLFSQSFQACWIFNNSRSLSLLWFVFFSCFKPLAFQKIWGWLCSFCRIRCGLLNYSFKHVEIRMLENISVTPQEASLMAALGLKSMVQWRMMVDGQW